MPEAVAGGRPPSRRSTANATPIRQRFVAALGKAVDELGGDRAAEAATGVDKSVWYDAKRGRTIPDQRLTWPRMREVLARLPAVHTGIPDWDELYDAVLADAGRRPREAPSRQDPTAPSRPALTSRPVPQQLPLGTRHFTARDVEQATLDRILLDGNGASVPIAVVAGSPGVGKTALAVHWARRASSSFPDGVLYTDLRGWASERRASTAEVLGGWLRALGMDPGTMPTDLATQAAALRSALSGRRLLVVLDNAQTPEQIHHLLPGSPFCAVLITSRQAMRGVAVQHGSETIHVPALTRAESMELLGQVVGTAAVDMAPAAAAALAELCGGLPLALRIVAETIRSQPTVSLESAGAALADEGDRLDQLEGDDPRSDVRTVFSWSYRQLPEARAAMFRLLGLFPGSSFEANTAAALAGTTPRAAARHLQALTRVHLVRESPAGRFAMHELVRLYAAELARTRESNAALATARVRLMHYYLHAVRRAETMIVPHRYRPPLPEGTSGSSGHSVHDYAGALAWLDAECGNVVALCQQDEPALDQLRWRLAFELRGYFFLTKRTPEWLKSHQSALVAATRSADRLGEALTRSNLGVALHESGDDQGALRQYEAAHRLFAEVGDPHGTANTLAHRAVIHRRRGEFDESVRLNEDALAFYRRSGSRRNVAITLRSIALAKIELGRLQDAERHLMEALEICTELRMDMDAARTQNALGHARRRAGRLDAALEAFNVAIVMSGHCGSRFEEALALRGLGTVASAAGDYPGAHAYWDRALRTLRALGSVKADEVAEDLTALRQARDDASLTSHDQAGS